MADVWYYGNEVSNWVGYLGSTYIGSVTGGTWELEVGFQARNGWHFELGDTNWSISFDGAVVASGKGAVTVGTNGWVTLGKATVSRSRTTSRQDFAIGFSVWRGSPFGGTSSWSGSDWLGPLDSWTVSYDGNGGSTPASQTKWYGEALTLAGAPSRAGYGFDGWLGSDGTTYAAGSSYTANASATMTAKWHRLYVPPACTLKAVRTGSASSTAEAPAGGYAYVAATWKVDTSVTSGNTSKSVKIEYRTVGASSWTAATTGGTQAGTSGTATAHFAAAMEASYEIRATVTDSVQATSWTATLGTAAVAIDFGAGGRSIGLLGMASDTPDTLTVGSTTIGKATADLMASCETGLLYGSTAPYGTYIIWSRVGLTVTLRWKVDQAGIAYWTCGAILPERVRPRQPIYAAGVRLDSSSEITNNTAYCFVSIGGTVSFQCSSESAGGFNAGVATWQLEP